MTFHFDCIFYYVSDMEKAIYFYRDVLGFKLISRDVVARFNLDGVLFELVPSSTKGKAAHCGNARLCLRVDNLEAAIQELKSKAVITTRALHRGGGMLSSFTDPDGNEICLWQYGSENLAAGEEHAMFAK